MSARIEADMVYECMSEEGIKETLPVREALLFVLNEFWYATASIALLNCIQSFIYFLQIVTDLKHFAAKSEAPSTTLSLLKMSPPCCVGNMSEYENKV